MLSRRIVLERRTKEGESPVNERPFMLLVIVLEYGEA